MAFGREPAAGRRGEPGVHEVPLALVRGQEDERVIGQLLALEALVHLALGADGRDVEERVELDALLFEDRRRHLVDGLDAERAPDRRALVGHGRDADHDLPAGERDERRPKAAGGPGGVEVMRLLLNVLVRLGQDPGARGQDQVVVAARGAVDQDHLPRRLVRPLHHPGDQVHAVVEEGSLGPLEMLRLLIAQGDVHEAGLVDMGAGGVDEGHAGVVVIDLRLQPAGDRVGGERPADANELLPREEWRGTQSRGPAARRPAAPGSGGRCRPS